MSGQAAGNSGQHSVSPAPTPRPWASREAESGKDRPAAGISVRAAQLAALTCLFWVGLFCDPVQFWLAGLAS